MKKKHLALFIYDLRKFHATFTTNGFLYQKICENFEKLFIISIENLCFFSENRPDRSKSSKMNGFFSESPRAHAQNSAQNRYFSENPRWGPYKNHKNHKNVAKNR